MTLVIIGVTTEIHYCTAASCDYGGKTNEIIIFKNVLAPSSAFSSVASNDKKVLDKKYI